jgi:hypothetical protein
MKPLWTIGALGFLLLGSGNVEAQYASSESAATSKANSVQEPNANVDGDESSTSEGTPRPLAKDQLELVESLRQAKTLGDIFNRLNGRVPESILATLRRKVPKADTIAAPIFDGSRLAEGKIRIRVNQFVFQLSAIDPASGVYRLNGRTIRFEPNDMEATWDVVRLEVERIVQGKLAKRSSPLERILLNEAKAIVPLVAFGVASAAAGAAAWWAQENNSNACTAISGQVETCNELVENLGDARERFVRGLPENRRHLVPNVDGTPNTPIQQRQPAQAGRGGGQQPGGRPCPQASQFEEELRPHRIAARQLGGNVRSNENTWWGQNAIGCNGARQNLAQCQRRLGRAADALCMDIDPRGVQPGNQPGTVRSGSPATGAR